MLSSDINWSLAILPTYFDTQSLPTLLHIIFSYPTCKRYEGRIEISKDQCDRENIESLPSIFFKDRRDRFAHGRSFSKIDECKSIMVDLFKRSTREIHSRSIFFEFPTLLHCNELLSHELYFLPTSFPAFGTNRGYFFFFKHFLSSLTYLLVLTICRPSFLIFENICYLDTVTPNYFYVSVIFL